MGERALLNKLFAESYAQIQAATALITEAAATAAQPAGINPIYWQLGHVVVARCNFLTMLAVPSIWDWATCKCFIPGSDPTQAGASGRTFADLRADLEQTQAQLTAALAQATADDLSAVKDDQTIAAHYLEYAAHEAFHAGQLELLAALATNGT